MLHENWVAIEKHVCIICGKQYDTGAILMHKRGGEIKKEQAVTGRGLCPEHQKLFDDGYLALIEVNNTHKKETLKIHEAARTGRCIHIKRAVAAKIFNVDIGSTLPMVYIDPDTYNMLEAKAAAAEEA